MSQQRRRLRQGAQAASEANGLGDLSSMSLEALRELRERLWDGVAALQSTDYVGAQEAQAEVNKQHDDLMRSAKKVDVEIDRRTDA